MKKKRNVPHNEDIDVNVHVKRHKPLVAKPAAIAEVSPLVDNSNDSAITEQTRKIIIPNSTSISFTNVLGASAELDLSNSTNNAPTINLDNYRQLFKQADQSFLSKSTQRFSNDGDRHNMLLYHALSKQHNANNQFPEQVQTSLGVNHNNSEDVDDDNSESEADWNNNEDTFSDTSICDQRDIEHFRDNDEFMETTSLDDMPDINQEAIPIQKYKDYLDDGDPIYECKFCGAAMWFNERINKKRNARDPVFSMCCMKGKVKLPMLKIPPKVLMDLLTGDDELSINFRENIRAYNMMFSFTSLGGKIDNSINRGRGPKIFRLHGENYHLMGSMLPPDGQDPKFSQIYIHDTDNEVMNRLRAYCKNGSISRDSDPKSLKSEIVDIISKMLHEENSHVKAFVSYKDRFKEEDTENIHFVLLHERKNDGRVYNTPTASEVAALVVGDFVMDMDKRDIVLERKSGKLKRISELHPCYLPLQYPVIFPHGEDGFRLGIKNTFSDQHGRKQKNISMRQWFAYRIQERKNESQTILRSKSLFQQFLVDGYTAIEANNMRYIRKNQPKLRSETYANLRDASDLGDSNTNNHGNRIFIPSSFTGGERYMKQNYMDAMAVCKHLGFPDLFITFTCNPKWPEITRYLEKGKLRSEDRPDILCRLFKMKLDKLIEELTGADGIFGKTTAAMYTIEFQKRGLPHAHILIFMHKDHKFPTAQDIDSIISAEIPDKNSEPDYYEVVKDMLIHGPCGVVNPRSPCMKDEKCTKFYPKGFNESTTVDKDGYPVYRRRDDGKFVEKNGFMCDNRYVVPHNKILSLRYRAHINVEWCNQSRAIKYLFKYIHKGQDRIAFGLKKSNAQGDNIGVDEHIEDDEIKSYFDCRYVSACEAAWRILAFPIHYRSITVEKLSFHEKDKQVVVWKDDDPMDSLLSRKSIDQSMFLAWMERNKVDVEARSLTYAEFPSKYRYDRKNKVWNKRKRNRFAIGRIYYVPPSLQELFYLRVLLNIVRGPTCYEDIRTFESVIYDTFKAACIARGLLDDDSEYIEAIKSASEWSTTSNLRRVFSHMLMSNSLTSPEHVWENTWQFLSDDILFNKRSQFSIRDLNLSEDKLRNYALIELDCLLRDSGSSLSRYESMPQPDTTTNYTVLNQYLFEERNYHCEELKAEHEKDFKELTDEQRHIHDTVTNAVLHDKGGVFFVYGFGGTGKTYLWKVLSSGIRCRGKIVLNVASSGIASLLLTGGRTAHSRFGIPINVDEFTTCSMKKGSDLANLMVEASLIIWDEAPMMSKHCFETLDRSLRDIIGVDNKPFAGKVVVFGGDFRQILPVITGGGRAETVMAALNSSYLWDHCEVLRLTKNMRLLKSSDLSSDEAKEVEDFSKWILSVGEGKINEPNTGEVLIDIPKELLISESTNPELSMCSEVYGQLLENLTEPKYFQDRAILCPTHNDVDNINNFMLSIQPGEERTYLSSDSLCPTDGYSLDTMVFTPDFLNSIRLSGLPNHALRLKIGTPVMLMRNSDPKHGLCNGTRLQITQMSNHILEARVITGARIGDKVLITRMVIAPSDTSLPFKMRRRQFPLSVAYAMTINKSQGQTLNKVGLYLHRPVFSHGQLYVAISRVRSKNGLKVLITDNEGRVCTKTMNVVYKEIFQNL